MAANIQYKYFVLPLIVAVFPFFALKGTHIIGGEMTYECLEPGLYRITMQLYRDCALGLAPFDSQFGTLTGRATIYSNNGNDFLRMVDLAPPQVSRVPFETDNPCIVIPPNICVEQGTYVFDVELPVSAQSYYIVYQRCCRNNTINNIIDPGNAGATFFIEITPFAQANCISSPEFNDFPPTVICRGFELDFDHSASDQEENSELVYSYFTPFIGGGTAGTGMNPGDPFGPDGVAPQPTTKPPFSQVSFIPPNYSRFSPLAGDPRVVVNSETGRISGVPNVLGQFVVGIQVQQYVNGQLASTVHRDFQFNVTNCEPTVVAQIEHDDLIEENTFVVRSCGEDRVPLFNASFQQNNIWSYQWEFYLPEDTLIATSRNGTFEFPGEGIYRGIMIANPDAELCNDTAHIQVEIYPPIFADFQFEYDTCRPGPVDFEDLSIADGSNIVEWNWVFKPGEESTTPSPVFLFETSGSKNVALEIIDDNGCQDRIVKPINYFPLSPIIIVEPGKFSGCAPEQILFRNQTPFVSEEYDIFWDFGDGNFSEELNPENTFKEPGTYDVFIRIVSPLGCKNEETFRSIIQIFEGPEAGFEVNPSALTSIENRVQVSDQSFGGNGWQYNFNDEAISFFREPSHEFRDTGGIFIEQVVFKENGCTDTAIIFLEVLPFFSYHLPNAFTPNGDGINDVYVGKGITDYLNNFRMSIWDRWGQKVFETRDPNEGWNGRKFNSGQALQQGVYVCIVEFDLPNGESKVIKEFATLVR
ncbi:MAG: hypothetical protein EA409_07955 [Saprospirales bacterium]|nr:MAG: hypothetical protein EA409_07955 [Saprospirales bacterium]